MFYVFFWQKFSALAFLSFSIPVSKVQVKQRTFRGGALKILSVNSFIVQLEKWDSFETTSNYQFICVEGINKKQVQGYLFLVLKSYHAYRFRCTPGPTHLKPKEGSSLGLCRS